MIYRVNTNFSPTFPHSFSTEFGRIQGMKKAPGLRALKKFWFYNKCWGQAMSLTPKL